MAMRGGRGRGGFGRGGGGRGGPPTGPVARDDDGTVLATQPLGPPPLFPEIELPELPEITAKETLLLLRRNDLITYSKTSPFFLESKQQKDGPDVGSDRNSDRVHKRQGRTRQPLAAVMSLLPEYFPEELFSAGDKRAAKAQLTKPQDAFWKSQAKKDDPGGLLHLDQLAQKEESKAKAGAAAGAEDEVPEEAVVVDTDEEEDMEFDDYYQGEHFDDDEGYDDAYEDGGGDEGPVY